MSQQLFEQLAKVINNQGGSYSVNPAAFDNELSQPTTNPRPHIIEEESSPLLGYSQPH